MQNMSSTHDEATTLTETDSPDERLDRDDVFHILQCRRRRLVLKYLQDHDGPADMRDVTERIAAIENDTTVAQLRSQERQRVYIALYQSHLPKMDRDGIINYQQDRGVVERTARTAQFDPYLVNEPTLLPDAEPAGPADDDRVEGGRQETVRATIDDGWKRRSLAAAGGGLALIVSIYAGSVPSIPSAAVAAALACTLFVALAAGYYRRGSGAVAEA